MPSYLQALIDYFSAHPGQALAAVFAASLLEAFVVIGTFIPGSSVVFVAGALIGLGAIGLWPTLAVAVFGAILGDGISYWLGRHHHERLRSLWPLRQHPRLLARGQAYFAEHGLASVFLGRFLSPTRAIVPVVAGIARMPPGPFYLMNVLSALAWAALHLLPGVLFGASLALAGAISSRLLVLLVAALLLLGGAWLFLGTLEDVVSRDSLVVIDRTVFMTLQRLRTEWVDSLMVAVTEIGSAAVAIPVIGVAAIVFGVKRRWRTLGYWLGAMVFAQALVWILKATLARARPTTIYSGFGQFSFPSGHAASSIVLYGFLAFLLARGRSSITKLVIALAAAVMILLISFSRLYLGAHWFSDVLGRLGFGALDAEPYRSARIGADVLIAVSAPDKGGGARHPLQIGSGAVPVLRYTEESGLGRIVQAVLGRRLEALPVRVVFTAHLASVLRTMALDGRGIAWLPQTLVEDDINLGRLVAAASDEWAITAGNQALSRQRASGEGRQRILEYRR